MLRVDVAERANWKTLAHELGFHFHTIGGEPYWKESAYYQFSLDQIERDIETPTEELHEMCMELVDRVCHSNALMQRLALPEFMWDTIHDSWVSGQPHLYGRMDFAYSGQGHAKLLELNYDTPTSLYEAGFFQWVWLEQAIQQGIIPRHADQYNSIQERLINAIAHIGDRLGSAEMYFSCIKDNDEERATVHYLQDVAVQAGLKAPFIYTEDIGYQRDGDYFVDLDNQPIQALFKLYPWEELADDAFGEKIPQLHTHWFEPPWKAILSNKGILPLLWEHFKGHPNLLPAYFEERSPSPLPPGWVRKPFFSREGSNIELLTPEGQREAVDGPYTDSPWIRQAYHPMPRFGEHHALIGSWVVGDRACGIGVREDVGRITKDSSCFVPHAIV
ncbi:Similarity with glutathionylspermidine synthase, group 1 [Halomonas citrativorans]|uniref:Similarity with glutathionylspermidine synthase, group 1 n=1 Tax=Halomonas citrativorans TaxID=2742612 RepID=A0A1R4I492_9GAMM|nr:glutathionylspermidine synthase family protein [Halomonas citrativorans]SJN14711.1 Similarity with glutathionylspermidine synthase, group 1 [Halomonas citrativorans]